MITYLAEFLLRFSIISLAILCFLRRLRKGFFMALLASTKHPSSSSTSILFLGNINVNLDPKRQKISPSSSFRDLQHRHREENNESIDHISEEQTSASREEEEIISTMMIKQSMSSRKRPAHLVVPAFFPTTDFGELGKKLERKEFQVEGEGFALANKKGKREVMEDGHSFMLDISDSSKQAFFVVIDGHGGRAATDFVAENLGKNIINEIKLDENVGKNEIEAAVRRGYSVTDHQFLNQKVRGGACAASVLVKDGELHVANVGDCKVILSRKGVANALTNDHRLNREDERARIENSGGFLDCRNGVWRVNGTLAVSRAFGDFYLKDHVISEPETLNLPLTSDCDFLIMASDGLWDKVGEQEAVDVVVSRKRDAMESCKDLVSMSSSRGGVDDVTVLVVDLQNYVNV